MKPMHVIVIGAGTLGMSSALHLAERGVTATVIEADAIASGSSGRSVGVVGTQHVTLLDVELRAYSLRRVREWSRQGPGLGFHPIGYLRLGRSESDRRLFERSLAFQRDCGIWNARILEVAEMRELVPDMSMEGLACGLFGPDDGFLDPHLMCSVLADKIREFGGSIRQQCKLLAAERRGNGFRLVTSAGVLDCDGVVIAAGAWASRVAALFGKALPVVPERHEAITIKLAEPLSYIMPMVMDLVYGGGGTGLNFRHQRPDELVAEIHKVTDAMVADPDSYDEGIGEDAKEHLAGLFLERLPALASAGFGRGWAGLYPQTLDGRPFVGLFDDESRLVAAAGAGGYGIQLGPVIGALAADWMISGRPVTVPGAQSIRPSESRLIGATNESVR